ncbi:uncharacterized protein LOC117646912 [Thrips palmi]|uniref:Uncharacterized protein LOC117646912 n=1 Tax=Thrips palmi TaxID=161013 RepID=A0A6P8Z2A2_THRPL|nr:uncharacterized protein LOC117646912 [Thrips palmi]XP_034244126.1 uncharacterized protein LOC117646912 [Thrips palmi]XP_034244127.1 uncharacterized protein LOC117646912 [Thrips palmi]XP_034244128.1 uncharacterized protein LOC117646912 [Thrips palmi]XP_034244129.1 uncharacterized protein LOC117646912 [Thrips palmi]XP_034244130.1 uncharacterized protein LOC117646912 [Thrips palmi]XP_034244131.1 uncharacterized protein LOC117646912 [Thrips palmi]XP_034244132.1 uncharacterized protein LOC1176
MLTRRRAKLMRLAAEQEPPPEVIELEPATQINDLSDPSLELVFSFLDVNSLITASQVCSRWRDLCSSRGVWRCRSVPYEFDYDSDAHDYRVIKLLRREHGVVRYTKLSIATSSYISRVQFLDNGEKLSVWTGSSLMVLLCLRHLLKDGVTSLHLNESRHSVSKVEALVLWETIANKKSICSLQITLKRNSNLLGTTFVWPQGSLTHEVMLSCDEAMSGQLCRPISSLLRVNRDRITKLQIGPEDQQALLDCKPTRLRNLKAVLLPSLLQVLQPMGCLTYLFLHSQKRNEARSRYVLRILLAMPNLRRSLRRIDITVSPDFVDVVESESFLGLVAAFGASLLWVHVRGLCAALADPGRGPGALKDLLTPLSCVRTLQLDVEPSAFPLHALLPRTVDGCSAEPVARLPASLHILMLGDPKKSELLCDPRWLQLLRRVMDDYPELHVIVLGRCLETQGSGRLAGKVRLKDTLVVPHPCDHYCQDCQNTAAKKKGYGKVYIRDLC